MEMIHVSQRLEPTCFDVKVRQRGLEFFRRESIDISAPLPSSIKLPTYWRSCLDELYEAYDGICAYSAIYIERTAGGVTVDHYEPKSKRLDLAYEWDNYRLSSSIVNSRKRDYNDVLDPFLVQDDWFYLVLETGHIYPNPTLGCKDKNKIKSTIKRLKLDDGEMRRMRCKWWEEYIEDHIDDDYLRRKAPFIYKEAYRQCML
jgi:uncharacterized protein (TIGR02646 family)